MRVRNLILVVVASVAAPSVSAGGVLPELLVDSQPVAQAPPAPQVPPVPPAPPVPRTPRGTGRADWPRDRGEGRTEERETLNKVVKAGSGTTLVLSNLSGDITVTGGPGSEIRIEATKRGRGRDSADARKQLDMVDVEVTDHAGRVTVTTVYRASPNRIAVDYKVLVPATVPIEVKSLSGDVTVGSLKAMVHAETISGNMTAASLGQDSWLKTVSGNVNVSSSAVTGEISVSSVSGNIRAQGLKVRSLSVGTVSGDVEMSSTACERASVRSVSGNVDIAGPVAKGARYEVKSHSGDIRFGLDGKTGFEVSATSFSGSLKSDLPLTSRGATSGRERGRHQVLQGVFGDGSAQFDVQAFSGNVTIVKHP